MMRTNRSGFTLVELLIVSVLGAVILGAAVQSLVAHERANRTTGEMIRGQDALRAALGIMEGELREVTTMGDDDYIGMVDIVAATPDSVVVRAQRTLGFVCEVHPSDRRVDTWSLSGLDLFSAGGDGAGDGVLVFSDGMPNTAADDRWLIAEVNQIGSSTVACPTRPGANAIAQQRLILGTYPGGPAVTGGYLDGVLPGAPVRAFERVTYGLFQFDGEWGLGRRASGELQPLVLGLAGPGSGLVFTYINADGDPITAEPVPVASVAGVRINARTQPRPGTGTRPVDLANNIFFRNNRGGS